MSESLACYTMGQLVGSGSFGECHKVTRKSDGKVCLCKTIVSFKLQSEKKKTTDLEIQTLKDLCHENIVQFYTSFDDKNGTTYIIMEYCENGDLRRFIDRARASGEIIDEVTIWKVFYQIIQALVHCHSRNRFCQVLLHRDVKPANIFLDREMNAKLGDFGVSNKLGYREYSTGSCAGTCVYLSPEQVNYMEYNEKCDVWALGCTIYEMCAKEHPFHPNGFFSNRAPLNNWTYKSLSKHYSPDLRQFVANMLDENPEKRLSVEKLAACPLMIDNLKKFKLFNKYYRV